MNRPMGSIPTLTEVIELADEPRALDSGLAPPADAVALEDLPQAELLARLQPLLEAWVDVRVRTALVGLQARWADELASGLSRELREALPALLAQALQTGGRGPGGPSR